MTHYTPWKKTVLRLLVVVTVAAVVVSASVGAGTAVPNPPHEVFGTVNDQNGNPIAGLTVEVLHDGTVIGTATTDSNGYYEIKVSDESLADGDQLTIQVKNQNTTTTYAPGSSERFDFTVEVTTTTTTTTTTSSSGGGGGGGGGANVPPPPVQVTITDQTSTRVRAKVTNARAGAPGVIAPTGGIAAGGVTLQQLTVTPKSTDAEARFFVDAQIGTGTPGSAGPPDVTTLGSLDVTPTYIADSELASVTARFAVDASVVASPKNVVVYQLDGGVWKRVKTTVISASGGQYVLEATASGTGTFVVGVQASATTTVTTAGTTTGGPGELTTTTASTPGEGPADTSTTDEDEADGSSGGIPGFSVSTALVALIAATLLAVRRRH